MNTIIAGAIGGLGDRLFALGSVIRLGRLLNRQPILWWMRTDHCDAEFSDLFKPYAGVEVISTDLRKTPLPDMKSYRTCNSNMKIRRLRNDVGIFITLKIRT